MIRPSELMAQPAIATAGDAQGIDALHKGIQFLLRFMEPEKLFEALLNLAKTQGVPVDKAKLQELISAGTVPVADGPRG
jgi:hypothetical protein